MINNNTNDEFEKSYKSSHRMGITTIVLIFGLFGIWSVVAKIDTTITAQGKVINQSYNKIVMHPVGGSVKDVFVKEGDFVKKDQALLKIDNTQESFQLTSNIQKHDTNLFLMCKLKAQSDLAENLDCKESIKEIIDPNDLTRLREETQNLFNSDMKYIYAKIDLLKKQNKILVSQNNGLEQQIKSNNKLLKSYQDEIEKWKKLLKSDAIDELKIIETQRIIEKSYLQIGMLKSKIEENNVTIDANNQQIELEKETFKNSALTKLTELTLENRLIKDTIISLEKVIESATIKSPGDGLVTDMKIHASGEVVPSQTQIMAIVPNDEKLIIEAYIMPTDIEKVYKGLSAEISFPAFINLSAKPIEGRLSYVSADVISSPDGKESYYVVLLEITPKGLDAIKQNEFVIISGMPSSAFIQIGKKTLMEYLTQPVIQMYKGIYNAN